MDGKTEMTTGCIGIVLFFLVLAVIGSLCWPYTINTWLVFFDKDPIIVWWQGLIMGFVPGLGQAAIPAAFVTWILMLFLS